MVDIAWGSMIYALVEASTGGISIERERLQRLWNWGGGSRQLFNNKRIPSTLLKFEVSISSSLQSQGSRRIAKHPLSILLLSCLGGWIEAPLWHWYMCSHGNASCACLAQRARYASSSQYNWHRIFWAPSTAQQQLERTVQYYHQSRGVLGLRASNKLYCTLLILSQRASELETFGKYKGHRIIT